MTTPNGEEAQRPGSKNVITNYVWGFLLFWALGMAASLAGNLLARDPELAGAYVAALMIVLYAGAVWWALKRKARGVVPGMVIAAVVHTVGLLWVLKGGGK
jgi:hypothetical protein